MSIGIMQPYFFPYIGYFHLMQEVNVFVIADDLNYIKNGYINRNSILLNNETFKITLQLNGASQNKLINEIEVGNNNSKLLETIRRAYKKAPYFNDVFPLIEDIMLNEEKNLARFLGDSLIKISNYLNIEVKILYSSEIDKDNSLTYDDRIIDICKRLDMNCYINAIGGKVLYSKDTFMKQNLELYFINSQISQYKQFNDNFIPNLSIIDLMMFNSKENLTKLLDQYELV